MKKHVVEEDQFDNGNRLLLNFGHTIGHAIENTAGYGQISHGEAVAIGMVQISKQPKTGTITSGYHCAIDPNDRKVSVTDQVPTLGGAIPL